MNAVGEWVGREPPGRSAPRGETAPPSTSTLGRDRLDRVVAAREQVGVRAARRRRGRRRRTAASRTCSGSARCRRSRPAPAAGPARARRRRRRSRPRSAGVCGVSRPSPCQTTTTSCMPSLRLAADDVPRARAEARGRPALAALPHGRDRGGVEAGAAGDVHLRLREARVLLGERVVHGADHEGLRPRAARRRRRAARPRSCGAGRGRRPAASRHAARGRRASRRRPGRRPCAASRGHIPASTVPPLFPESTTARITPATAAAATTAASTAFFTGSEATLARPWPHTWKSS